MNVSGLGGALLVTGSVLTVVACQDAWRIGAVNRCEVAIEVAATGTKTEVAPPFKLLKPGESRELREVEQGRPTLWFGVRTPGGAMPTLVSVRTVDLTRAPKGAASDFYYEVTDCPT
jgi:hypothetical protein